MEERLKEEVELKLGRKIVSRGDCQLLADLIFEEQHKQISYNTFRRFFNVDKTANHQPSIQTLNVLSSFVGFRNYFSFASGEPSKVSWELQNELYFRLAEDNTTKLLNFLIACRIQKVPQLLELLTVSFRELLLSKKYSAVHEVSKSKGLNLLDLSYSERIQFGRSVGLLLRKINIPKKELIALAENNIFLEMVFLIFVDYSSLNTTNTNHIQLMESISNGEVRLKKKDALFFQCLNYLSNFLTGKPNAIFKMKPQSNLHPILYSRVCSVRWIQNTLMKISNDSILKDLQNKLEGPLENKMDYIFELITASLLLKDFGLMELVLKSESHTGGKLYQESHLQQVLIVKIIFQLKNGLIKKAANNLVHINKKGWGRSYHDIYELFLLIVTYKLVLDEASRGRVLNSYLQRAKQLKYSHFNKEFLLNYFE